MLCRVNHTILSSNIVLNNSSTQWLVIWKMSNCRTTLTVMLTQMCWFIALVLHRIFECDLRARNISLYLNHSSDLIILLDLKEPAELLACSCRFNILESSLGIIFTFPTPFDTDT